MVNLTDYSVEELQALREQVNETLKARRKEAQEAERQAKLEREERFKGAVNDGDMVKFLYNREERVAQVKRANEKSITIEIDGKDKYVGYTRVIEIVERAPEEADTDEQAETEEVEAEETAEAVV